MRLLFLFVLGTFLITSCNSNTLGDKAKKEKTSKFDEDGDDRGDGGDDRGRGSSWTKKDRNRWLDECETQLGEKGKQICSCVLAKVERKYPDPSDAENATEEEGARFAKECLAGGGGGGDDYQDDDDYSRDDRDDRDIRVTDDYDRTDMDGDDDRGGGARWTSQQKQSYIQGCAGTAVQSGLTRSQANSYCTCMVNKLEQKMNFQKASRMTQADFQAAEWQEAAMECRPNF